MTRFVDVVEVPATAKTEASTWRRCRLCGRPEHDRARLLVELEGRSRMAAARMAAGAWPDELDRAALDAFPDASLLAPVGE